MGCVQSSGRPVRSEATLWATSSVMTKAWASSGERMAVRGNCRGGSGPQHQVQFKEREIKGPRSTLASRKYSEALLIAQRHE